jgi:rhodanese-related sulfurtransferase
VTPRSRTLLALLAILFVIPAVRAQEDELASPKLRISWNDFKKLYDARGLVLIDVRSDESFETGHIPGARSIPLPDVEKKIGELRRLKKPIVLYCA